MARHAATPPSVNTAAGGSLSETESVLVSQRLQQKRAYYVGLLRLARRLNQARRVDPKLVPSAVETLPEVDPRRVYKFVFNTKALATRVLQQRRLSHQEVSGDDDPLGELQSITRRLVELYFTSDERIPGSRRAELLKSLLDRKDRLQRELPEISVSESQQSIETLARYLPADGVIVDFVESAYRSRRVAGIGTNRLERFYDAFVIRRGKRPGSISVEWVELGPAAPIDEAATEWTRLVGGRGLDILANGKPSSDSIRSAAKRLYQLVWSLIESHLAGARFVFVVPDGRVHRVPWGALEHPRHKVPLVTRFTFVTLSHASRLIELNDKRDRGLEPVLLIGNIDYGAAARDVGQRQWRRLPGTAVELERVSQLLGDEYRKSILDGRRPKLAVVLDGFREARTVHLATHGFFMRRTPTNSANTREKTPLEATQERIGSDVGRNPLLNCGLALAGANGNDPIDGVLTGADILGTDLQHTSLVVLSACETNVGEEVAGEGVFSLARAFHGAGVESVVASLWKVNDAATAALVTEFYRQLLVEKRGCAEALRHAQVAMLERYDPRAGRLSERKQGQPAHPQYWAAFVISGAWR